MAAVVPIGETALNRLFLSGWRQFDDVDIEFHSRLTVITGANGAGKTTILNILAVGLGWRVPFASTPSITAMKAFEFAANVWRTLSQQLSSADLINTENTASAEVGSITFASGTNVNVLIPRQPSSHRFEVGFDVPLQINGLYIPSHRPVFVPVECRKSKPVAFSKAYQDYSISIRAAWTDTTPNKSSPVRILKATLLSWADGGTPWRGAFDDFSDTLLAVLPSSLAFIRLEEYGNEILLRCETGTFTLDAVSGGIAAIIDMTWQIFLYSKLEEARDGFVVLIDEPENHLHPELQRSLLFKLTEQFSTTQFVVASHAPLVVTSVRDANVYALAYEQAFNSFSANRVVRCLRLREFERTGTASDVLRQVLGLDYTMPVWAANILEEATTRASQRGFDLDALVELRTTLDSNSLGQYLPEALVDLSNKSDNNGGMQVIA